MLTLRSWFFWTLTILHFIPGVLVVVLAQILFGRRAANPCLNLLCCNIVRLSGVRYEVRRAPGCDPKRPCFYAANHVNVFDPFLIGAATQGVTRGLELESHLSIPVYGWLMTHVGNVPVPDRPSRRGLARMTRVTRETLESGASLVVFPEGTRTRTGALGPFRSGLFRLAVQFGTPIVPISVVGSYRLKRAGSSRLHPAKVVVHLHEAIEPGDDPVALSHKVRQIVNGPLEESPEM